MKILDHYKTLCLLAKSLNKNVLVVDLRYEQMTPGGIALEDILDAAPYLREEFYKERSLQAFAEGNLVIICDSRAEMERLYAQTFGDDGPVDGNKYRGPATVYAVTINSGGEIENENT